MSSELASYSEPFQEWFLCMILCWIHTGNSEIRFLTVQGSILLCRSDMLTYNTRKFFFFHHLWKSLYFSNTQKLQAWMYFMYLWIWEKLAMFLKVELKLKMIHRLFHNNSFIKYTTKFMLLKHIPQWYSQICTVITHKFNNILSPWKRMIVPIDSHPFLLSQVLETTSLFSISVYLPILKFSYKWKHVIYGHFYLASFM